MIQYLYFSFLKQNMKQALNETIDLKIDCQVSEWIYDSRNFVEFVSNPLAYNLTEKMIAGNYDYY